MRRIALLFILLCGAALPAFAQNGFTTVTGTITDPNGVKYSCGTIIAQLITAGGAGATLNGQPFTTTTSPVQLGCPTTPGTGAAGSFAMRLADSGVILPSNTTWKFTVNISGGQPPLGTGPQTFSFTTAINCSTNTPSTCTSNQLDISTQLSALAPALGNGGSGSGFPITTPVAVNTGGSITVNSGGSITAAGTGTIISTNTYTKSNRLVDVTQPPYNIVPDTVEVFDAVTVNGTAVITSATAKFQTGVYPAKVGQQLFVSTQLFAPGAYSGLISNGQTNTTPLHCTVASVDSDTQIHSSCNSNANAGTAQHLYFGTDWHTQLAAAWTAAQLSPGCGTIVLPQGNIWTSTGQFNSVNAVCTLVGSAEESRAGIVGLTTGATLIWPPDADWSTCNGTAPGGDTACFGGANPIYFQSITISGGMNGFPNGGTNLTCGGVSHYTITAFGTGSFAVQLSIIGLGAKCLNSIQGTDVSINGQCPLITYINDGVGDVGLKHLGGTLYLNNWFVGDVGTADIQSSANTFVHSFEGGIGPINGAVNGGVSISGDWWSKDDTSLATPADNLSVGFFTNAGGILWMDGNLHDFSIGRAGSVAISTGNGVVYAKNTIFRGNATGFDVLTSGTGQFHDQGGNTFVSGRFSVVTGSWYSGLTLAQANLTAQAANIAATTLLTSPAVGISANVYKLHYDMIITTPGTAGTIAVNLICPNGTATFTQPGGATVLVTATAGTEDSGVILCHAAAASAIQYSVTGIVTPGALQYSLNLRLDPL